MTESFRAEVLKILGQNLRKIRIDKKLTTADVALHCDLSLKSTLYGNIEIFASADSLIISIAKMVKYIFLIFIIFLSLIYQ